MSNRILITGPAEARARAVIERALYSGWVVSLWAESARGFACVVACPDDQMPGFAAGPQRDRLGSFGWGAVAFPDEGDIRRAVVRVTQIGF